MSASAASAPGSDSTTVRLCPACDYDLRGISSPRCPECGLLIENAPPLSIPWEHRRQMGYVRAFWRTVRLAMFQCKRLAQAAEAPVDETSARRFRLVVSLIAAVPPAAILLAGIWHEGGTGFIATPSADPQVIVTNLPSSAISSECMLLWSAGATLVPVLPIGMLLTMWLATGSARIWFRARPELGREQRPAALSHYACAPLVWLPIAAAAVSASLAIWAQANSINASNDMIVNIPILIAAGVALFCLICWWLATMQLLARTTLCGWKRLVVANFALPVGWVLSAAIGLGLWPALAGLIWIGIDSLRK